MAKEGLVPTFSDWIAALQAASANTGEPGPVVPGTFTRLHFRLAMRITDAVATRRLNELVDDGQIEMVDAVEVRPRVGKQRTYHGYRIVGERK